MITMMIVLVRGQDQGHHEEEREDRVLVVLVDMTKTGNTVKENEKEMGAGMREIGKEREEITEGVETGTEKETEITMGRNSEIKKRKVIEKERGKETDQ